MPSLFEMFPAQWTPCAFSHELTRKPIGAVIACTEVVLFRDEKAEARAFVDRCPHRGARLSLGRVADDGCLQCPFHGWRYRGEDGRCAFVPLAGMSDEQRSHVRATPLPVLEKGGLVFVYTAADRTPEVLPTVPEHLLREDVHVARHSEVWNTHWSRAMENMLDAAHLPFVHRRTIGRGLRKRMNPDSVMEIEVTPADHGFRTTSSLDHEKNDAWLDWNRPNGMVLHIPVPGKVLRQHVYCVPIDAEHTKMMLMTSRDFAVHNPIAHLGDLFSLRVMAEDKRVVESIRPMEVPPLAQSHMAPTDRATFAFRTWYRRELRGEGENAREGRPG